MKGTDLFDPPVVLSSRMKTVEEAKKDPQGGVLHVTTFCTPSAGDGVEVKKSAVDVVPLTGVVA